MRDLRYRRYGLRFLTSTALPALVIGGLLLPMARPAVAQAPVAPDQPEGEVLTRGPLHEAFAEMVNYDPQPGLTVDKQPPAPIEELPPEEKPEGEGYVWIPGYWDWDEQRNDFIWVSGVWRLPPPDGQWVPGYWNKVADGYQWVSGYWSIAANADAAAEVEYLPEPPESLEYGPTSVQPSVDYFWVSGCWRWYDGRYVWRAGYWMPGYDGWVWVPAHYIWTPCGYVFVPGHWDYSLVRRGLGFCPVYFAPTVYLRPHFVFVPRVAIYTNVLHAHLFCRPRYGHYYFGDYYDPGYARLGIYPWFTFYHTRHACDPLYTYHHWYFGRRDPGWSRKVNDWHNWMVGHQSARPPHTFAAMQEFDRQRPGEPARALLAGTLNKAGPGRDIPFKLESVDQRRREQLVDLNTQIRKLAVDRSRIELTHGKPPGLTAGRLGPQRVELPIKPVEEKMRQLTGGPRPRGAPPIEAATSERSRLPELRRGGSLPGLSGDGPHPKLPAGRSLPKLSGDASPPFVGPRQSPTPSLKLPERTETKVPETPSNRLPRLFGQGGPTSPGAVGRTSPATPPGTPSPRPLVIGPATPTGPVAPTNPTTATPRAPTDRGSLYRGSPSSQGSGPAPSGAGRTPDFDRSRLTPSLGTRPTLPSPSGSTSPRLTVPPRSGTILQGPRVQNPAATPVVPSLPQRSGGALLPSLRRTDPPAATPGRATGRTLPSPSLSQPPAARFPQPSPSPAPQAAAPSLRSFITTRPSGPVAPSAPSVQPPRIQSPTLPRFGGEPPRVQSSAPARGGGLSALSGGSGPSPGSAFSRPQGPSNPGGGRGGRR